MNAVFETFPGLEWILTIVILVLILCSVIVRRLNPSGRLGLALYKVLNLASLANPKWAALIISAELEKRAETIKDIADAGKTD